MFTPRNSARLTVNEDTFLQRYCAHLMNVIELSFTIKTLFNIRTLLIWLKTKNTKKPNPMYFRIFWSFISGDLCLSSLALYTF